MQAVLLSDSLSTANGKHAATTEQATSAKNSVRVKQPDGCSLAFAVEDELRVASATLETSAPISS